MEQFRHVLHYAYQAGASGYLAGRAIWWKAAQVYPDLAAMEANLRDEACAYMRELNALTDARATPWMRHAAFADGVGLAGAGPEFYKQYKDFSQS